jgi:hypothetical protein
VIANVRPTFVWTGRQRQNAAQAFVQTGESDRGAALVRLHIFMNGCHNHNTHSGPSFGKRQTAQSNFPRPADASAL